MSRFLEAVERRLLAEREERMAAMDAGAERSRAERAAIASSVRRAEAVACVKREAVLRQTRMDPDASPAIIAQRSGCSRVSVVKWQKEAGIYVHRGSGGRLMPAGTQAERDARYVEAQARIEAAMAQLGPGASVTAIARRAKTGRDTVRRHLGGAA